MPYGGTTHAQDKRIERCVSQLTPKFGKESAIRICKDSILKSDKKKEK